MNPYEARSSLDRLQRLYQDRLRQRDELIVKTKQLTESIQDCSESTAILTAVLSVTQDGVVSFIQDIVTTALRLVYGEAYGFVVEFELKRGQSELQFYVTKNGRMMSIRYGCGVGVADVCSFALRVALWALKEPGTTPVLIFDEPFRHVHGKAENERLGNMISNLSELMGLQIIIVSGESALTAYADRGFTISQTNGVSQVEVTNES